MISTMNVIGNGIERDTLTSEIDFESGIVSEIGIEEIGTGIGIENENASEIEIAGSAIENENGNGNEIEKGYVKEIGRRNEIGTTLSGIEIGRGREKEIASTENANRKDMIENVKETEIGNEKEKENSGIESGNEIENGNETENVCDPENEIERGIGLGILIAAMVVCHLYRPRHLPRHPCFLVLA